MRHLLFVILLLIIANISFGVELNVMYEWKYVNFTWDSEQQEMAIKSGDYDPKVIALYDVDVAPDGRIFVTSVRDKGVPASLMTVSKEEGLNGPLLAPYPDWSWYQNDNDSQCNGIISVYRVDIKCNHLFVLDCGKIGADAVCPPQLLIFNLEDDSLVDRVIIPPDVANNKNGSGLLVTPLADVRHCNIDNATEIIVQNAEDLQFVSGMKVRKENLLGLSNRFQHVYSGTLNLNETNFRIFSIDISQIRKEKENCFASCKHHNHRSWIRPDKPKPWFKPDKSWSHWIPWYLKYWFNGKWNTSSTLIFSKNP
ncbi:hypothetical protein P5V15_003973 [Pogonomyrmex californicus]